MVKLTKEQIAKRKLQLESYNLLLSQIPFPTNEIRKDLEDLTGKEFAKKYKQYIKDKKGKTRSFNSAVGQANRGRSGKRISDGFREAEMKQIALDRIKEHKEKIAITKVPKIKYTKPKSIKDKEFHSKAKSRSKYNLTKDSNLIVKDYRRLWVGNWSKILPNQPFFIPKLKEAWKLKGGVIGQSNNEVQYRLKVRFIDQKGNIYGTSFQWIIKTSGIDILSDFKDVVNTAWKNVLSFDLYMKSKDSVEIEYSQIDMRVLRDV
jgi:hypothetical protein